MSLQIVVEGDTDVPVVSKLAKDARLEVIGIIDLAGKSQLDLRLSRFNDAANGTPWFVLRDLDHDAECAPALLADRSFVPKSWMVYRIAVREVEAWLLADAESLADFLGVEPSLIPTDPDGEADPTTTLVNLARRSSRATVRKRMVPKPNSSAQVGPLYEAAIIEYGAEHWSLDRACRRSASLKRAREALRDLGRRWRAYVDQ